VGSFFWDITPCGPFVTFFNGGFLLGCLFDPEDGGDMLIHKVA
jgi:hypothetical protein